MPPRSEVRLCACGHEEEAHRHYRVGTDCSLCECPRFRSSAGLGVRLADAARSLSALFRR